MKRYDEGHRGMLERAGGEWIRYIDHCEAMKRAALSAGEARRCATCGGAKVESSPMTTGACDCAIEARVQYTPPRHMVADSAKHDCCANCMRPEREHSNNHCPHPFTTVWHAWDYDSTPGMVADSAGEAEPVVTDCSTASCRCDECAIGRGEWAPANDDVSAPKIDSRAIARDVQVQCSLIPGATFYNAAEMAIAALLAAQPPAAAEAEQIAREAVEQFKAALYRVPLFGNRVSREVRERLTEAHCIMLNLPALLDRAAMSAGPASKESGDA